MTEYRVTVDPPPGDPSAVTRHLNRSMLKLAIAEWHHREFNRLDDELTRGQGSSFPRHSLDSLGHGDGSLLQLAAAFDAFACAVAHRHGLDNPDGASFGGWSDALTNACGGTLGRSIRAVAGDADFKGLAAYRNLAAHRGVVGGTISMGERADDPGRTIRLLLPDALPPNVSDRPRSPVNPVLVRYSNWARPALRGLHDAPIEDWNLADDPNLIADYWDLEPPSVP